MLLASAQYGFSMVELLIGITIVSILVVAGLPSYTAWIQNTQIRNATESVLNGLQLARNEAVRQNLNVQLVLGTQSSWTISLASDGTQIQTRNYGAGSKNVTVTKTPSTATTITFNSLGRVTTNADATAPITQLDFTVPTTILAATAVRELRILVASGGNVRMCDPDSAITSSDPRYC